MELISQEELTKQQSINLAPMIDFLFLLIALFATFAISRETLYDTEIHLVEQKEPSSQKAIHTSQIHHIHIGIDQKGSYKWITKFHEYPMASIQAIQEELLRQYELGKLHSDKAFTEVLLHIDQNTPWKAVSTLIFSIKESGFTSRPVYAETT